MVRIKSERPVWVGSAAAAWAAWRRVEVSHDRNSFTQIDHDRQLALARSPAARARLWDACARDPDYRSLAAGFLMKNAP